MPRDVDDILAEIESEGDTSEAISFDSVLKVIDKEVEDMVEEIPSIVTLLKLVHKQGFWRGVNFGREFMTRILEDEEREI